MLPALQGVMREGVLAKLHPYQREGIAFAGTRDGAALWWCTGAGKALGAITWLAAGTGSGIITTDTAVLDQFATEIRRFTYLEPYILRTEDTPEVRLARRSREAERIARWTETRDGARQDILDITQQCEALQAQHEASATKLPARRATPEVRAERIRVAKEKLTARIEKLTTTRIRCEDRQLEAEMKLLQLTTSQDTVQSFAEYMADCTKRQRRAVLIIGHDALPSWLAVLRLQVMATSLVIDEAHKLRSGRRAVWIPKESGVGMKERDLGNRASAVAHLSKSVLRRLITTATPIHDSVGDLWAQLDYMEPGAFGTHGQFRRRWLGATPTGWEGALEDQEVTNTEELQARLAYCVHCVPSETVRQYMPSRRRIVTLLAPSQLGPPPADYGAQLRAVAKMGKGALREVHLRATAQMKEPQVITRVIARLARGQKVIVFTARRAHVERVGIALNATIEALRVEGAPWAQHANLWAVHGETPPEARAVVRNLYMAHPGPCCLVGTNDSWGTGQNLQDTDYLLVLMLPYSPGDIEQEEGRVHRLGGTRDVDIEFLLADRTADMEIAAFLFDKLEDLLAVTGKSLDSLRTQLMGTGDKDALLDNVFARLAKMEEASPDSRGRD